VPVITMSDALPILMALVVIGIAMFQASRTP